MELTEKTVVTAGKIKKTIADIKPGDKVVARVLDEEGKMTVRSIRLAQESRKAKQAPEAKSKGPEGVKETPGPAEPPALPQDVPADSSKDPATPAPSP